MDDSMILDLYEARSEYAIRETERKYGGYLTSIAMNILGDPEDAGECVNDTYHKAWNAIPPARPRVFSAYLGKIARNLSINRYKARRALKRSGGELALVIDELEECIPSIETLDTEYDAGVIASSIDKLLMSLDEDSRRVFVRRYWHADSVRTISVRFSMSESKVKSMLYRTRNKLKLHLEKEGIAL